MDWRAPVSKTGIWASVDGHGAFRVCHVEAAVEPDLVELAGDVGRMLLHLQIVARGDDLLLVSAKLHVVEGHLGDEAHLDVP